MKIKMLIALCLVTWASYAQSTAHKAMQATSNVIIPGQSADIKFNDIDGDGDMDVIFNGNSNGDLGKGIALNDGTGIFTRSVLDVTSATVSCGFADLDNNGLIDYYAFGNGATNAGALIFQNTDGSFTKDQSSFAATRFLDPDVSIVDFNNDGFTDIFISAWDEITANRYSEVFVNDGTGKFSISAQPNLIRKGYGSSVWGDVDNDGWLDLLLNGDGGASGEVSNEIYRLYKNNKGVLEPKATFSNFRQLSVGDGARMVDWDNDGKLDILLTGWSSTTNRQATMLYTCTDKANFIFAESTLSNTDFPGVSESSIETADLNNDGRIDLLITGFNGNQTNQVGKYNRNICGYYLNQSATTNVKPSTPGNLVSAVTKNGEQTVVTLSWNATTDDKTAAASLTYNLSLKNTTTGRYFYNPMAVASGTASGWRRIPAMGNMFLNRKWVLSNLPEGTYQWTVQAIDANFTGGAFAVAKTFSIAATGFSETLSGVNLSTSNGNLLIENTTGTKLNIAVYSTTGSLISQSQSYGTEQIPLCKGIYIVKVSDGTKNMLQKVVI